jgi:AhpD family alkylhydroperoxidase
MGVIVMDKKLLELIAVGAATTANCVPCLKFHHEKAVEFGATEGEILEAIEMGRKVRKGAARAWDKEAAKLFGEAEDVA